MLLLVFLFVFFRRFFYSFFFFSFTFYFVFTIPKVRIKHAMKERTAQCNKEKLDPGVIKFDEHTKLCLTTQQLYIIINCR